MFKRVCDICRYWVIEVLCVGGIDLKLEFNFDSFVCLKLFVKVGVHFKFEDLKKRINEGGFRL